MRDITSEHPLELEAGESVYEMDSGRRFILITIHDDQHSHQTQEVFHMMATLIDQDGAPVVRSDGKIARDEMGHSMTYSARGADLATCLAEARDLYLGWQDQAAQAHDDLAKLNIAKKSTASYSPIRVSPNHRDAHGNAIRS